MPSREKTQDPITRAREVEILRVAMMLFQRDGYDGTPVTRIADEAGMTPGNLYWYFPSKKDLLASALEEIYRTSYERLAAADASGETGVQRLETFVRTFVSSQVEESEEQINFGYMSLQNSLGPDALTAVSKWQQLHRSLLKEILQQGTDEGSFVMSNLSVVASIILTSIEYVVLWYKPEGQLDPSELAELFVESTLRLVGAAEAHSTMPRPTSKPSAPERP